jgi:leucyl aminopeptidase
MQWKGAGARGGDPVVFVGKGVTFDTGGISLKPAAGMEEMKGDMAGAATVVGLMQALAERKAKVNAVGVVGLVENMPSGRAQRPGDVVTFDVGPDHRGASTPTPRAAWCSRTVSGTRRTALSRRR